MSVFASRALAVVLVTLGLLAFAPGATPAEAASSWTAGQPFSAPFPRTGIWWPDPDRQPLTEIARYDYVVLQDRYGPRIPALRALHPGIVLLNTNNACEVPLDSSAGAPAWKNAAIAKLPNEWLLTQRGTRLSSAVGSATVDLPVADTGAFRVGDVAVLERELVKVESIGAGTVRVRRGVIPARSPAAPHAAGTRVAAVVTYWPGSVVMDLSTYCPKVTVDASVGPETWGDYNARAAIRLAGNADWDGILLDRTDGRPSLLVGGPWIRSIDPARDNVPVADGYTAFDAAYVVGLRAYEARIRSALGTGKLLLGNWADPNYAVLNGTNLETFPRDEGGSRGSGWADVVFGTKNMLGRSYLDWLRSARQPNLTTVQTYDDDSALSDGTSYTNPSGTPGWKPDYRKMRFGLCTALLGDGFFDYELNTAGHAALGLLWFDEFDDAGKRRGYLDRPIRDARTAMPPLDTPDLLRGVGDMTATTVSQHWKTGIHAGYAVAKSYDGGAARLDVTASLGAMNDASFYRGTVGMLSGTPYTITFRARSSVPTTVQARVAKETAPYTGWIYFDPVGLGTGWKTYELSGVAKGTDPLALLVFGIGRSVGTIWIDDVKLQTGDRLKVFRRDFRGGVAVVNSGDTTVSVPLGGRFQRIHGVQVPSVNDGKKVTSVSLPPRDGAVLLRPALAFARLSGADRYGTATAVTKAGWPAGSAAVVLATGANYPDALASAPLAKAYDGPLLLVKGSSLDAGTDAELRRLAPTTVFIVGGTGVVPETVRARVAALPSRPAVVRLGGADRYETSALVARQVKAKLGSRTTKAVVCSGQNHADALSIAPVAAANGWPMLLVKGGTVSAPVKSALSVVAPSSTLIVGTTAVVPDSVRPLLTCPERVSGGDAATVSRAVAEWAAGHGYSSATHVGIATAQGFPDALAAGAFLAQDGGVLLLVPPTGMPAATSAFLAGKRYDVGSVSTVGGTGVVPETVVDQAKATLAP